MSSTATYTVSGMTCGHCVSSVTEEVTNIPGVTDVQVDLASGAGLIGAEQPGAVHLEALLGEQGVALVHRLVVVLVHAGHPMRGR